MSFNFQCAPMYSNQHNQVIGYMCNSDETNVEGFENTPSLASTNAASLANMKTLLVQMNDELQRIAGQMNPAPAGPAYYRITDNGYTDKGSFATQYPAPNQIILDGRNANVDAKGNGSPGTGVAAPIKVGATITGPFVPPGTTVTAVQNTSRLPSNPYVSGTTVTVSKPLVNVKTDRGLVFVYGFSN